MALGERGRDKTHQPQPSDTDNQDEEIMKNLRVQILDHLTRAALALALTALLARAAQAHDFFLIPQSYLSQQSTIEIDATISAAFPAVEIAVTPDRIAAVRALSPSPAARAEIIGSTEKTLRLRLTDAGRGVSVVALRTVARDIDYAEDRIDPIMAEYEVAPDAVAAVNALPRPRTWRVRSTRVAKTHVCVGDCNDRTAAVRAVGGSLEFVAATVRDDVSYRLLLDGNPMPNYPIAVVHSDGTRRPEKTDEAGQVALATNDRGVLMLFAAYLQPPPESSGRFDMKLTSLTMERR